MARQSRYTAHKARLIEAIDESIRREQRPPSVRELSELLEVGVATVHLYLTKLSEEGIAEWRPKSHRSLKLTAKGVEYLGRLRATAAPF